MSLDERVAEPAPGPDDDCPQQLERLQVEVANLRIALESSRRIGAAVGIVMAQTKATYDDAFAILVHASQLRHRKIRDLADDVILTGTLA